jgi:methylated-DNA-[protein]-cysteine S-methyltransferase
MILYKKEFASPVGIITVVCSNDHIINLSFGKDKSCRFFSRYFGGAEVSDENALCRRCIDELAEYFSGERRAFDLPIRLCGTQYQQKIWNALRKIPYGETVTYAGITALAGAGSARSAGGALGQNPVAILLPCHRVIGADGMLGGFCRGYAMTDIKQKLLLLEGVSVNPS